MDTLSWMESALKKRQETLSKIPNEWVLDAFTISKLQSEIISSPKMFLSEDELSITEIDCGKKLAEKLATGCLSAVEVAKAYMHRAAIAIQLTNCSTEILFEYGLNRAQELDVYFEKYGKPIGPFHGLPISLKDSFNVDGFDSTLGYVCNIGNSSKLEQSALTNLLIDLGAVLYIKTNIPQTLMTADSENNIFGRTLNPNNPQLTAGGLSGGEGALVRQRGSIIGVGTDVAGSIRIPAACCGVYGFKPSSNRIPYHKQTDSSESIHMGIIPSAGPLANSFIDLQFFFEGILKADPWKYDFTAHATPYTQKLFDRKLVVGVIYDDPDIPVHPPVAYNIREAIKLLGDAGHKVVNIREHPSFERAWKIARADYAIKVKGEPTGFDLLAKTGEPLIKSLRQESSKDYLPPIPDSLLDVSALFRKEATISKAWHDIFCSHNLDVLLMPVAPYTAPPHDTYGIPPYTSMWNLVNYPAISIPFGITKDDFDEDLFQFPKHLEGMYAEYKSEIFRGGIGSIQIIAPTNMDEKLLAAGAIIDGIINHKTTYQSGTS